MLTIPEFSELNLTPFQEGDQANLIRHLNEDIITRNTLAIPSPYRQKEADDWIAMVEKHRAEYGVETHWGIHHQSDGLIGGIGNMFKKGKDAHVDEIGYWLAVPYHGRGWMTAVVGRYTQYLQDKLGILRIEANVFDFNPASARVLEKAGFQREGYRPRLYRKGDQYIDGILYAWLADEEKWK